MQTGSSIQRSYLKFDVSGIGPVQSAMLRLYVTDGSPGGGAAYAVANEYLGTTTPWTETGLSWRNAPTLSSPALATTGGVTAGTWTELDVTRALPGDGTYSFGLDGASSDAAYFGSKESSNAPRLAVTYLFGAAANHAPVAGHDVYALNEDAALTVPNPGVLANDTDADGDQLTTSVASPPAHGSLALQANGGFTYIPVTYEICDVAGVCDPATVTITITAVNDNVVLSMTKTVDNSTPPVASQITFTLTVTNAVTARYPRQA